jgi:hypothetical protein
MKGLFKQVGLTKLGYWKPVDVDSAEWPKAVLTTFLEEFPEFTSQEIHINFARKEPKKGYAIGAITIGKNSGLAVPVIISNFKLADMDIIIAQGQILPLTRENIFTLFSNKTAFSSLSTPEKTGPFVAMFDNALQAAQSVPGAKMGAVTPPDEHSFIDNISSSVTKTAKEAVLSAVARTDTVKAFEDNDTLSVLEKISTLPDATQINIRQAVSHTLERDIYYIHGTQKSGEYVGIFGNSDVYDPQIVKLTEGDIEGISHVKLNAASKIPEDTFVNKFAEFSVKNDSGARLLINHDNQYIELSPSEKLSSNEVVSALVNFKSSNPESGRKYVLKVGNEVMRPVQVQNVRYFDKKACVTVFDGLQAQEWRITPGIKEVLPHESEKNVYYVPKSAEFIELKGKFSRKPTKVPNLDSITKISSDMYTISGPNLEEYVKLAGKSVETASFVDTMWAIIQTGGTEIDLSKVASLKPGTTYSLSYVPRIPVSIEKCASDMQAEYLEKLSDFTDNEFPLDDLVKIAAEIKDKTTVDAILSLGFLNRDNVSEFVGQIPMFEQVLSYLAKLLLMIRLGFAIISEQPVQEAMVYLVKVVERLRGVSKLARVE